MLDPIGANAVRSLSVDVANLSARLAVQMATLEHLMALTEEIDPSTWEVTPVTDGDDAPIGFTATIPGEEIERLQALLGVIRSVQ